QNELDRLLERARSSGRLTQHDLVEALSHVEMTPDVLAEIYRRCRAAGIEVEETEDLDLTVPVNGLAMVDREASAPAAVVDEAAEGGSLPGADLIIDGDGRPTVVMFTDGAARGSDRAHIRRLGATMRRRSRLNSADRSSERGGGTSDP